MNDTRREIEQNRNVYVNSIHVQGPDSKGVFPTGEDLECSELLARAQEHALLKRTDRVSRV